MAERVALENYQMAQQIQLPVDGNSNNVTAQQWNATLQEPHGWQKQRHLAFPTTDLSLVTRGLHPG